MAISVKGLDKAQAVISSITVGARDLKPISRGILSDLRDAEVKIFQKKDWPRGSKGQEITLVDTRRMVRSLIGRTRDSIVNISNKQIDFGTRVWYGKFHQYGTKYLPQRRFVLSHASHGIAINGLKKKIARRIVDQALKRLPAPA